MTPTTVHTRVAFGRPIPEYTSRSNGECHLRHGEFSIFPSLFYTHTSHNPVSTYAGCPPPKACTGSLSVSERVSLLASIFDCVAYAILCLYQKISRIAHYCRRQDSVVR